MTLRMTTSSPLSADVKRSQQEQCSTYNDFTRNRFQNCSENWSMCRRFRRVRRLAQQVVTVTRRIWRVCQCCGNMTAAPRQDVVPLAAIIGNTKASRASPNAADTTPVSFCSNCHIGLSTRGGCCAKTSLANTVDNLKQTPESPENVETEERCKRNADQEHSPSHKDDPEYTSTIYEDKYSLTRSKTEIERKPTNSTLNESSLVLHIVAGADNHTKGKTSRERHDGQNNTPKYTESRQSVYPSGTISRSSQTDNTVAMRFYTEPSSVAKKSSKTDTLVSPDQRSSTRFYPLERINCSQSPKTELTPMVKLPGSNGLADLKDMRSGIGVLSSESKPNYVESKTDYSMATQTRSRFSPKSCVSREESRLSARPPDLVVEYAIVKDWYRIYPSSWTVQKNITSTRTGRVDLAYLANNKRQIAVKTLITSNSDKESQILIQCQGPYVAQLCACMVQCDHRFLCMTYYTRGDLSKWLDKDDLHRYFKENEAIWITGYILAAIEFLHNNGILHLDIKSSNILIDNRGYLVLSDFGSAVRMGEVLSSKDSVPFTPAYASPEVQAAQKPDALADLWSSACVFYEVITKTLPHRSLTRCETLMKTAIGSTLDVSTMSSEAGDFLTSQLKIDKRERLGYSAGAREVMRHAIFKSVDWDEIKYGSRLMDCRLLRVFKLIEQNQKLNSFSDLKTIQHKSVLSSCRNNNNLEPCSCSHGSASSINKFKLYPWSLWDEDAEHKIVVAEAKRSFDRKKSQIDKAESGITPRRHKDVSEKDSPKPSKYVKASREIISAQDRKRGKFNSFARHEQNKYDRAKQSLRKFVTKYSPPDPT